MAKNAKKALEKVLCKRNMIRGIASEIIADSQLAIEREDFDALRILLETLSAKEKSIADLDNKIEEMMDDLNELEAEVRENQAFKDEIIAMKSKINKCLKKSETDSEDDVRSIRSVSYGPERRDKVKLPKLFIEKFDGDFEKWQTFWAQFSTAIHENSSLSKIEKFNYLKSFLTGQALGSIQGLVISEVSYDTAIGILKDRYGRKDIIVQAHVNKLLSLAPVRSVNNLQDLRNFYDSCEIQVRSLESLGVELNSYGSLFFPHLLKLIPDEVALEYNRTKGEDQAWDVRELLNFLKREIENRERTFLFRKQNYEERSWPKEHKIRNVASRNIYVKDQKQATREYRKPELSAAALHSSVKKECLFCNSSDHDVEECDMPIADKKISLRKNGRCFNCLKKKHTVKFCFLKVVCSNCGRKHNRLICEELEKRSSVPREAETMVSSMSTTNVSDEEIFLQTLNVRVSGRYKSQDLCCLLDGGSQRTFIQKDCSRRLNLQVVGEEDLTIHSFGSRYPVTEKKRRVRLILSDPDAKDSIEIEALETPNISSALIQIPGRQLRNYCAMNGISLAEKKYQDTCGVEISILIGSDFYWKIVTGKIRRISGSLVALETRLGWSVSGSSYYERDKIKDSAVNIMKTVVQSQRETEDSSKLLRQLWELEALGIQSEIDNGDTEENKQILEQFHHKLKFEDGRYHVGLPWNNRAEELGNNYGVAKDRFQSIRRRFERNPQLYQRYEAVINQYLREGIAEEASDEKNGRTYYMPHQAVIRDDKTTTKLRVVFDASSHLNGFASLNDCLHSGPNMTPDIFHLLIKFRQNKIAFTADIEQAFLQIKLIEEDRNAVKFIWLNDVLENNVTRTLRMTRVIFGATSSPFLLAATIKAHIKKYEESNRKAFSLLNSCLYVDDLISGAEIEGEALTLAKEVKLILGDASFNMRKWKTNSSFVQRVWNDEEKNLTSPSENTTVLGYVWDTKRDVMKCKIDGLINYLENKARKCSKRGVLEIAGRVYDPTGTLNPFTIRARIFLQEIWQTGVDWDTALDPDLEKLWTSWCNEIPQLQDIEIPRHYFEGELEGNSKVIQLHCFTDASQRAYGAVIYIRYKNKIGEFKSSFLASKARVAPLKKLSLPRLELMATLIGARLTKTVLRQFPDFRVTSRFWTDSTIALYWIKGRPNEWKPFVENRVREIQEKTETSAWFHCPGKDNPADLLTRGETAEKLKNSKEWWHGPRWLLEEENIWPQNQLFKSPIDDVAHEKRKKNIAEISQTSCITDANQGDLFDRKKYSDLNKILRVTAWIQRFIFNARHPENKEISTLSAEELRAAENYWIKKVQEREFRRELVILKQGKRMPSDSKILLLNPFLDEDGILRLGGRLQHAGLSNEQSHPIILPNHDFFTDLQISHSHKKVGHAGVSETLTQLRDKFWVLKGRQRVKSILHKCIICNRYRAKPYSQDMAPLPPDRIREAFPFEITGVDFAGPLYVKDKEVTSKAYIALFTCAVTRAVHIELVSNLTTEKFKLAFRRFISRRGICRVIYSDNAKTFKKAEKDLKKMWDLIQDPEIKEYFAKERISWKFIVERAAWWGGFWERLVRSTKSCLKKILGKASLGYEEMETTLTEVEGILNSRPLTYVYSEGLEPEPLTPGHFLIGRRLTALPPGNISDKIKESDMTRRYKYRKALTQRIWKRWSKDYLLELRSAHQVKFGRPIHDLKEGKVVLIQDENLPKLMWRMGLVTNIHHGRDNKVRACTIRTPNGNTIKRAVQVLYPLELDSSDV